MLSPTLGITRSPWLRPAPQRPWNLWHTDRCRMARDTLLYYDEKGVRLPSVTECLQISGVGTDFSLVPPEVLERARVRGQAVHAWIEAYHSEHPIPPAPEISLYAAAYEKFLVESGFVVALCEFALWNHDYRYVGTADLLGKMGGRGWLLDVKTSVSIPAEARLQTAGYELALPKHHRVPHRGALQLRSDGSWCLEEHREHREDRAVFLSCVRVTHWKLAQGLAQLEA